MFDKRKDNEPSADTASSGAAVDNRPRTPESNPRGTAMIGKTITIKGDITGEENLVIEGKVDGTIHLKGNDLTVGQSGKVSANLAANVVRIDGEVKGDIVGVEKVVITKTGKVQGNIVGPRVTLEDGAKFKGSIDMDPTGAERASSGAQQPQAVPGSKPMAVEDKPGGVSSKA
jgi:cytoskeletal protein CcmA (bactofilin family)